MTGIGAGYRRLWTATVVSRFGDALRTPALALLAATLTRDPRAIAAVVIAGQLPPLLLGLLGGVYADRWDRRRAMATLDGARAVLVAALAGLVALGRIDIAGLAVAAFLLAALGAFFDASAFAVLPDLVDADRLATANGRLQAGAAIAGGFIGTPAAGVLFGVAAALPFAVDAVSFAVAALLALTLPPLAADRAATAGSGTSPRRASRPSAWREARDGLRWIYRNPGLRTVVALTAASNLAVSALITVLVLYALDVLRVSQSGYGIFISTAVVGSLAGGLGAGRLAARLGTLTGLRWILAGQTLALAVLALSRHPGPAAVALAVFSAGTAAWNALAAAYSQRGVPRELLGRVGGGQRMAALLTAPVGAALAGLGAARYGLPAVLYATTGVFALVTVAAWTTTARSPDRGSAVGWPRYFPVMAVLRPLIRAITGK